MIGIDEIDESVYFEFRSQPKSDELKNVIRVPSIVYTPVAPPVASQGEPQGLYSVIFASEDAFKLASGATEVTLTLEWEKKPVDPETVEITLTPIVGAPAITSVSAYAWGAYVVVTGDSGSEFSLSAMGTPYESSDQADAVAESVTSIGEYGRREYTLQKNELVQTHTLAQKIADGLLASYSDLRRDANISWPGNAIAALADILTVTEYKDELLDTRNNFYIMRQSTEYNGGLRVETDLRRIV